MRKSISATRVVYIIHIISKYYLHILHQTYSQNFSHISFCLSSFHQHFHCRFVDSFIRRVLFFPINKRNTARKLYIYLSTCLFICCCVYLYCIHATPMYTCMHVFYTFLFCILYFLYFFEFAVNECGIKQIERVSWFYSYCGYCCVRALVFVCVFVFILFADGCEWVCVCVLHQLNLVVSLLQYLRSINIDIFSRKNSLVRNFFRYIIEWWTQIIQC